MHASAKVNNSVDNCQTLRCHLDLLRLRGHPAMQLSQLASREGNTVSSRMAGGWSSPMCVPCGPELEDVQLRGDTNLLQCRIEVCCIARIDAHVAAGGVEKRRACIRADMLDRVDGIDGCRGRLWAKDGLLRKFPFVRGTLMSNRP